MHTKGAAAFTLVSCAAKACAATARSRRPMSIPVQKDSKIMYSRPPSLTLHTSQIKDFSRQALMG
ncbi:hypothetical protein DXT74_18725 [Chromobacterium sp. Rain0013]|nr:hypothetical protein DXT74_18725 [Chromobacterium sp. Rain0013]